MALLDGMPTTADEMREQMESADKMFQMIWSRRERTPKEESILQALKEGLSFADIFQITKQERDAMFLQGCQMIQAGQLNEAKDWMARLYSLEPLDERVSYMLGIVCQMQGNYSVAAKMFVQFLALDATNPEGFLRLGECFYAAKELKDAKGCFEIALGECERGKGTPATLAHAKKMLALVDGEA